MQRMLELIEATLDADVSPAELAAASGYSYWHFLHLFRQEVGMSLNRYRTRRRLAHAVWHVSQGMRITDAALRWGFETHSGFYRAFQLEYGCSPTAYLREHRVRRPSVPLLKEEEFRMLTRERFREALSHWGLDLPITPVLYPGSGHTSETAVYVGDDLIFKAYRDDRTCRLALALAEALDHQGIPAALPVPLPDGALSLSLCGMQVTLCHRVPGDSFRADRLLADPESNGRRIGAALAGLHKALAGLDDLPLVDDQDCAAHLTDWALPRAKDALPDNFPADYAAQIETLRSLPRSIIHRDPNPANLVDAGDRVGFIDFDLSVRSVRIFDPCYHATAILSETFGRNDAAWPAYCKAVLTGYDSVSPLTEEEWAAVPTMLIGNELLALAAFAGSTKYREVFEVNQRMLAWMIDHIS